MAPYFLVEPAVYIHASTTGSDDLVILPPSRSELFPFHNSLKIIRMVITNEVATGSLNLLNGSNDHINDEVVSTGLSTFERRKSGSAFGGSNIFIIHQQPSAPATFLPTYDCTGELFDISRLHLNSSSMGPPPRPTAVKLFNHNRLNFNNKCQINPSGPRPARRPAHNAFLTNLSFNTVTPDSNSNFVDRCKRDRMLMPPPRHRAPRIMIRPSKIRKFDWIRAGMTRWSYQQSLLRLASCDKQGRMHMRRAFAMRKSSTPKGLEWMNSRVACASFLGTNM